MRLDEYQDQAETTAIFPDELPERDDLDYAEIAYCALGLAGEAGEVAEKVKKAIREDDDEYIDDLGDELGDVLWYWSQLARVAKFDADYVAERNLDKLLDRQERGVLTGEGDDR